jgi:hypothetical protein
MLLLPSVPSYADPYVAPGFGLGWERLRSWGAYGDGVLVVTDKVGLRVGGDIGLDGGGGTVGVGRIVLAGHPALPVASGFANVRLLQTWRGGPARTYVGGELLGHFLLAGVTFSALCNVADASFELGLGVRIGLL